MPVQAAHKLEPPLAYAASKARQPPKLPRHKPYASCGTYPPNTMPPSVQDEVRARSARKSQKEVRRSVACGHTGLQRCRGSASNLGGCAVQRPPGRCSGPQPLSGREAAPGGTLTSSPTSVPGNQPARASYRASASPSGRRQPHTKTRFQSSVPPPDGVRTIHGYHTDSVLYAYEYH